jgi:hypothetical protein
VVAKVRRCGGAEVRWCGGALVVRMGSQRSLREDLFLQSSDWNAAFLLRGRCRADALGRTLLTTPVLSIPELWSVKRGCFAV